MKWIQVLLAVVPSVEVEREHSNCQRPSVHPPVQSEFSINVFLNCLQTSEMIRFSALWPNIWPHGWLKWVKFKVSGTLGVCLWCRYIRYIFVHFWSHCGLKMDQIWGLQALSEIAYVHVLIWGIFQKWLGFWSRGQIFGPLVGQNARRDKYTMH